jgi:hypothetical protein
MTLANSSGVKVILTAFIEEVWNAGNVDASDKYIAPKYTIHHDPPRSTTIQATRGTSGSLISLVTRNVCAYHVHRFQISASAFKTSSPRAILRS